MIATESSRGNRVFACERCLGLGFVERCYPNSGSPFGVQTMMVSCPRCRFKGTKSYRIERGVP